MVALRQVVLDKLLDKLLVEVTVRQADESKRCPASHAWLFSCYAGAARMHDVRALSCYEDVDNNLSMIEFAPQCRKGELDTISHIFGAIVMYKCNNRKVKRSCLNLLRRTS